MTSTATWIETFTGRHVDIQTPIPEEFCITDIAHALSNVNRYGGHIYAPYSVAQHAVLMSRMCPTGLALECLHHDDAEAYIGDMPSPFKSVMPEFQRCEARIERAIRKALGLPGDHHHPDVKHWDKVMLMTEARDFNLGWYGTDKHSGMPDAHPSRIVPWDWRRAKAEFINRHDELTR